MTKAECKTCSLLWCGKGIGCVSGGPCKANCPDFHAGIDKAECMRCTNLTWNGKTCVLKKTL
jgi:hypothetical protein